MRKLTPKERAERVARAIVRAMFDVNDSWHGMRESPEWESYKAAKKRCNNPNDKDYRHYGQRGIQFKFRSFKEWYWELGPRPSAAYTVDRIDNDSNYQPGNVRWATRSEQQRNKRKPVRRKRGSR